MAITPSAITLDISIIQGDPIAFKVNLWADDAKTVPYNYTGHTAKMQVRRNSRAPVILECTTENGRLSFYTDTIPILDANGNPVLDEGGNPTSESKSGIQVSVLSADTQNLPVNPEGETWGYDLQIEGPIDPQTSAPSFTKTVYRGTFSIEEQYTR